jgi:hypothetical protein
MDPDYLENLLFKVKNKTQCVNSTGYEPLQPEGDFSVQNVQKHLQGYLRICARKPGIEKSLAVRGHIQQIRYSKKRVCVDFRIGRPPVGESSFGQTSSAATLSAVPSSFSSPEIRKGPVRFSQTDPFPQFVGFVNGGVYVGPPIVIPLSFPNLSHDYWENYKLTGEYHVKRIVAALP